MLALAGLVACGSGAQPAQPAPPAPATPPAPAAAAPAPRGVPAVVAAINKVIADPTLDRNTRCGSVFGLFDQFLAAGVSAPAAAAVLTDRSWIVVDDRVEVIGGKIPVDLVEGDSTFVVHCLATPNPQLNNRLWSDWVIYGRIHGTTARTLRPFLAAGPEVTLIEYALVYPDGRIEQYRPAGRHSMHL